MSRGPKGRNPGFLAVATEKRNNTPKHDSLFILLIKGEGTGTFIIRLQELTHRDASLLLCAFSPSCPICMMTSWSKLIRVVATIPF